MNRTELRDQIGERFSLSEIHQLCFSLGIDYENLPGETKIEIAQSLIEHCERHNRLPELKQSLNTLRPGMVLEGFPNDPLDFDQNLKGRELFVLNEHTYTLSAAYKFVGRVSELQKLTDWAANDKSPIKLIVGQGGEGKSALAWHWVTKVVPDTFEKRFIGRIWWSFYDKNSSYEKLILNFLSYVLDTPFQNLSSLNIKEQENKLFSTLSERPFLIVFDGLERAMMLYSDVPSLLGDRPKEKYKENTSINDQNLSAFIRRLTQLDTSKVLITSRNYPTELTNRFTSEKIFEELTLKGLTDFDALLYWREAGLSGDKNMLLQIFNSMNNYALFIEIFTGEIKNYRRSPGNLKRWLVDNPDFDPFKNTKFELALEKMLKVAITRLTDLQKHILNIVAALVIPTSFDFLERIIQENGTRKTFEQIDLALTALENRGLLGWDKKMNQYEMHPVVRGFIWTNLDAEEKRSIYKSIFQQFRNITSEINEELLISRDGELQAALDWLTQSSKRVLTVTGPPASGKTTFLKALIKNFQKLPNILCLFADADDFSNHEGQLDVARITEWVTTTNTKLETSLFDYQELNVRANVGPTVLLMAFAEHLGNQLPNKSIVFIIDEGTNFVRDHEWRVLEKSFIEPLGSLNFARLVIGLSNDQRIHSYILRNSETRLELNSLEIIKVQEQAQKVILKSADLPFEPDDLLGILPGYNWAHPGLNMLLYVLLSDIFSQQSTYDATSLLLDLFDALGYLPESHDKKEVVDWLLKISEIDYEWWQISDLQDIFGIRTSQAWEMLEILQSTMLIINNGHRYALADGIKEFVRGVKQAG